ncbi:MAG TPA: Calx-beta domain-containing protein [Pyrinomonadaceae bacterium]|jgi:hypothetical protein
MLTFTLRRKCSRPDAAIYTWRRARTRLALWLAVAALACAWAGATRGAALTFTSTQTGGWEDANTWGGAGVPGPNDSVTIASGTTVTLDAPRQVGDLSVKGALNLAGYDLLFMGTTYASNGGALTGGGRLIFHGVGGASGTTQQAAGDGAVAPEVTEQIDNGTKLALTGDFQASSLFINSGCTLDITSRTLSVSGPGTPLDGPGTLVNPGSTVRYNGSAPQRVHVANVSYPGVTIDNPAGVTLPRTTVAGLQPATLTLVNGVFKNDPAEIGILNAFGTIARTGTGTLDILNMGNQNTIIYFGSTPITPGRELRRLSPGSGEVDIVVPNLTLNLTNTVTLTKDLTVSGVLTFTSGTITTGPFKVVVTETGSRGPYTSGYVNGTMTKNYSNPTFPGPFPSFSFDVGTENGSAPFSATLRGQGTVTVTAKQGPRYSGANYGAEVLQRYWTVSGSGSASSFGFSWNASDVVGNEALYQLFGNFGFFNSVARVNPQTHGASVTNPSLSQGDWTLAEPGAVFGRFEFGAPTYQVAENGVTAEMKINRVGGLNGNVSVTYNAPSGTATGGASCSAGVDYTSGSGTALFGQGTTGQTISVPLCADSAYENDETVNLALSLPTGGAVLGAQTATVLTITDDDAPTLLTSPVLVSEFRLHGPGGAGDQFVELYNNTDAPVTVNAADGSAGWAVVTRDPQTGHAANAAVIPNGTLLPARGHYLLAGGAYSLGAAAAPDQPLAAALADAPGAGLLLSQSAADPNRPRPLDVIGFGDAPAPFGVGTRLPEQTLGNVEHSYVRRLATGTPQTTNDNAADFALVVTDAALAHDGAVLGAPAPENATGPVQRNARLKAALVEPQAASADAPNRVRDATPGACGGPNCAQGTLDLRRRFVNQTGQVVTALRFRVVEITTAGTPATGDGPAADLRLLSSTDIGDLITTRGTLTVKGTLLEATPAQAAGGGLNAAALVALPDGGLQPGQSLDVRFLLGVQTTGSYRFFVNVEALTAGGAAAAKHRTKLLSPPR